MTNEQLAVLLTRQLNDLKRIGQNILEQLPDSLRKGYNPIIAIKPGPYYTYPILDELNVHISDLENEINILLAVVD